MAGPIGSPPRTPRLCPRCACRAFTVDTETVWRDTRGVCRGDVYCQQCSELLANWSAYRAACQRRESILGAKSAAGRPGRGAAK